MTYRFKLHEPIAKGVSRIGLEQIDIAEARLASSEDIPTAIHDARRCLKRLRALLRLIRPALAESLYRRETRRIAGIGQVLAGARDRHVMQQTLAKLEQRFADALPKGAAARLRRLMANGAGSQSKRAGAQERRQALAELNRARTFFANAGRRPIAFEQLADGLERAYRKARRAHKHAYRDASDEAFHAWRKTVQQHWRHMQLLSRGWPEILDARAGEAKELSRLVGEDHDLAVLVAFAEARIGRTLPADDAAAIARISRACQVEIRALARPHAERLFAEPADELKDRIGLYWASAQRLSALAPPKEEKAARAGPRKPARPAKRAAHAHP
jgi:hypothetical protein